MIFPLNDNGNILINEYDIIDSDILAWLNSFKLDNCLLTPDRLNYLAWHREKFQKKAKICKIDFESIKENK